MENQAKIRVLVGLGNEGSEYEKTYHNVGAFVARRMQDDARIPSLKVFPLSGFMNVIGSPVKRFVDRSGAEPAQVLVIHDEADLPIGEYKLSFGGGSAGHKGVASVIATLQTADFWRLRIGVRDKNEQVRRKAEEFVLNTWSKADEEAFSAVLKLAVGELTERGLF